MSEALLDALRQAVGEAAVSTDAAMLEQRRTDRSGADLGHPLALVRPASTAAVSAVLRIANEAGVAVIPQGALTGLAGGASATPGSILLDLTGMNRILSIDPVERQAVVQPGVIVADLAAAAAEQGLFYAPDPVSAAWATVGGTIATNAGGMRCIKYGVTRDAVRALEVVLADGTVIRTSTGTIKNVAGLDLTALMVGSEGTLGVVTEATLELLPAPGEQRGVSALFPSIEAAFAAANRVAVLRPLPATLELLDSVALDAIRRYDPNLDLDADAQAWLIAVTDSVSGAEDELAAFEAAFRAEGAIAVTRATDADELDRLLATRRALHPGLAALHGASLNGDLAIPRGALGTFRGIVAATAEQFGIPISLGGHVGDGNLHPVIAYDPNDEAAKDRAWAALHALLREAQALGGTVTGEHGIGVEKLSDVAAELSPRVQQLQYGIKQLFDPKGILNPGKKYPLPA